MFVYNIMVLGLNTLTSAAQAAAASVANSLTANVKGGSRIRKRTTHKQRKSYKGGKKRTISKVHKKSLKSLSKKLRKIASTASMAASAAQSASKAKTASQSLSKAMTQTKSLQAQAQQGLQKALSVGRSIGRV